MCRGIQYLLTHLSPFREETDINRGNIKYKNQKSFETRFYIQTMTFFFLSRVAFTNTNTRIRWRAWWRVEEDAIRGKEHEERGRGIVMYRDRSHDRPGQGRAPRQVPKQVYTRVPTLCLLFSPSLFFPPICFLGVGIIRGIRGRRGEGKGRKLVR